MGRISARSKRKPRSPLAKHIGMQLLKLRQRDGLTMRDVAERTGISNPFVSKIENGQSIPGADTLYKIANVFNVKMEFFFESY